MGEFGDFFSFREGGFEPTNMLRTCSRSPVSVRFCWAVYHRVLIFILLCLFPGFV